MKNHNQPDPTPKQGESAKYFLPAASFCEGVINALAQEIEAKTFTDFYVSTFKCGLSITSNQKCLAPAPAYFRKRLAAEVRRLRGQRSKRENSN